jgi:hypothetical protein
LDTELLAYVGIGLAWSTPFKTIACATSECDVLADSVTTTDTPLAVDGLTSPQYSTYSVFVKDADPTGLALTPPTVTDETDMGDEVRAATGIRIYRLVPAISTVIVTLFALEAPTPFA